MWLEHNLIPRAYVPFERGFWERDWLEHILVPRAHDSLGQHLTLDLNADQGNCGLWGREWLEQYPPPFMAHA